MIGEMRKILKITDCALKFFLLLLLRCPFDAAWTTINAVFLQRAFDAVSQGSAAGLSSACLFYAVANLRLFLYNGTVWSVYAPFAVRMEGRLRVKLFRKISSLSCKRIEDAPPGDWLTRLNTDVQKPFSQPVHFPFLVCAAVNICVSAVILLRINPDVFGWVMLFVIPHIAVSHLLIARAMPKLNRRSLEAAARNTSELTSLITCADVAALFDGQEYLMKRFERSSLDLLRANMGTRVRSALSSGILPLFGLGGYLTLLAVSGGRIAEGKLTFGDLTAAFQYRGGVLAGALTLINCLISIQSSMAGIRRINETMAENTD